MIYSINSNAFHIPLADRKVQCVVTSPPYWGLRDYGISDQIGLESTPAAYVAHIVAVMRECWRVLKDDGVLWLNLGDSYAGGGGYSPNAPSNEFSRAGQRGRQGALIEGGIKPQGSLKPKDLCGIPWRVAFALQDDGWYLRSDIIWSKPNPMPESVTDRPTKAHEYIFLLTKQARYYYDAEAIREPPTGRTDPMRFWKRGLEDQAGNDRNDADRIYEKSGDIGRNRRSVWTVATSPYSGAHFACFPPALIEPMILAGTSARGECPQCGKAWVRVIERETGETEANQRPKKTGGMHSGTSTLSLSGNGSKEWAERGSKSNTLGWRQQCTCPPHDPIPQIVLDPFAGSGTTGRVAIKHGRRAVLLDLNTKYIDLQFERTSSVQITMGM